MLLAVFSACVLPPPNEEGVPVQHQPPRILPASLNPPPEEGWRNISIQCTTPYIFLASVSDPDADDTVYWRVFVDYQRVENDRLPPIGELPPNAADPRAERVLSFPIMSTDPNFGARLAEPHTVELWVADRRFHTDGRSPLGRAVQGEGADAGLTDSFVWAVGLTDTPGCN
ncbi:MAG: hypothetical protein HYZ27_05305 [Deltaproteobacteria bacterium]|nr:hypothetical protein [Deltaproteobacteria bacterium]